jgi:hypothetical protein
MNKITPGPFGWTELPFFYKYLSDGGKFVIYRHHGVTTIVFHERTGILGEFSGWIFSSDGSPPTFLCNIWRSLGKNYPNWFYCISD